MKNWSWKAVLAGVLVDLLGYIFGCILIEVGVSILLGSPGLRSGQFYQSPLYTLTPLALGPIMDVLGGYVAAAQAPTRKIAHAFVTGCASLGMGMVLSSGEFSRIPLWFRYNWVLVVPAAFFGGWLRFQMVGEQTKRVTGEDSPPDVPPIASPFED